MPIPAIPLVFAASTAARIFTALAARATADGAVKLTAGVLTSAATAEALRVERKETYTAPKTNAAGNRSGEGFGKRASEGERVGKPPKKNIKGLRRSKSGLGIGKRKRPPRKATPADIRRAGVSSLKRGSKSLAAFIAARYSPEAIAKYQDYAGRLRRSIRLRRQVVQIDANTFRVRKHIVKTDTAGNNPYSCTCPDFSQFSEDARTWLGSQAGPFNPCKHMMAVRDRGTPPPSGFWQCSGGSCTSGHPSGYATEAECQEAVRLANFLGGQCTGINYIIQLSGDGITWISYSQPLAGPIAQFQVFRQSNVWVTYVLTGSGQSGFNATGNAGVNNSVFVQKRIITENGDVDTGVEGYSCGNPPLNNCPSFP